MSETIAPSPPPRSAYSVALKKPLDHERRRQRKDGSEPACEEAEPAPAPVSTRAPVDPDRGHLIDARI